jgi:hypothetical protein
MSFPIKWLSILLFSPLCWCQQPSQEVTARTLYLDEAADHDQLPSIPAAKAQRARKASQTQSASAAKASAQNSGSAVKQSSETSFSTAPGTPSGREGLSIPPAQHLGLRYNLVLVVDRESGKGEPVESDRVFQPGECVALELEANHSGYLYVLDQGSSGKWKPLLPSAEMPEESNIISSRTRLRVPQKYCFEIESPPGEERLFVVLSRNPGEVYSLDETVRSLTTFAARTPPEGGTPMLTAENRLSHEVGKMQAGMSTRDLKITKIGQATKGDEPPGSVYVVNASAVPSGKVVTEIRIRHN